MEDFFSPEDIRAFMARCDSDRQRIILFLLYNYGLTIEEAIEIKSGQFIIKPDYLRFNFTRKLTGKTHSYKIQFENFRLFYRMLNKLQAHETVLHKDKNLPVSEGLIKKDLFDLAVTVNRKITPGQLFDSHLYWLFRKGVSFSQAVEEYGISLSGKPFKVWESAMLSGRLWPFLLE
jgi:integrase